MTSWSEKWDVHTHTTFSPDTWDRLERYASDYARFVRVRAHPSKPCCAELVNGQGEVQREIEHDAYHGAARLEACDRHGVSVQVLSPTPMMIPDYVDNAGHAAEICRILNDDNQRLVSQHPDRFVALGAVPLRHTEHALAELERIKKNGMRGIEINSNVDGWDLDAAEFFPVFEACQELDMAVFVHPWAGFMSPTEEPLRYRMEPTRHWRPWLLGMPLETALAFDALVRGGVHQELPRLRVLYAHGGGAFPALLGRLEHGSYCRPDLFANTYDDNLWGVINHCGVYTDTLTHNPWALRMLVDMLGSRRVALGSDFPYPLGEIEPFRPDTLLDPKGNECRYPETKGLFPGHQIECLPSSPEAIDSAWEHFHWIPRDNADGERALPVLTAEQKENLLFGTAKRWLGLHDR